MADEASCALLVKKFDETVRALEEIWRKLGLSQEECLLRKEQVVGNVTTMLADMVAEEDGRLELALSRAKSVRLELQATQEELQTWIVNVEEDLPLIDAAETYQRALDQLKAEKTRRICSWNDLHGQLTAICSRLGEEHRFDGRQESVPTLLELDSLTEDVEFKKNILKQRIALFEGYGQKIRSYASILNYEGKNAFEVSLLNSDEPPSVLSDHDVDLLSAFYTELHEKYEDFVEKLQKECNKKYATLAQAWDQCKIGFAERERFLEAIKDPYSLETLTIYQAEIDRMNQYYEERRVIFEMLLEWESHWLAKLDLESREADPKRYCNRGGLLLKEEKEKRAVDRKLLKARQCLEESVHAWNEAHPNDPILVDGLPVLEKLETTEINYEQEKEDEKRTRKFLRKAVLEGDYPYGPDTLHANRALRTPCGPKSVLKTPSTVHQTPKNRQAIPHVVIRSPSCSCIPDAATVENLPPILPASSSLEEVSTQPSSYGQFVVDLHSSSGNQVSSFICDTPKIKK